MSDELTINQLQLEEYFDEITELKNHYSPLQSSVILIFGAI